MPDGEVCMIEKKKKAGYYSQQGTETLSPRAHEKLNPVNHHISDLGSRSFCPVLQVTAALTRRWAAA